MSWGSSVVCRGITQRGHGQRWFGGDGGRILGTSSSKGTNGRVAHVGALGFILCGSGWRTSCVRSPCVSCPNSWVDVGDVVLLLVQLPPVAAVVLLLLSQRHARIDGAQLRAMEWVNASGLGWLFGKLAPVA